MSKTPREANDFHALLRMVGILRSRGNDLAACIVDRGKTPGDYITHTVAEWDKENKEAWNLLERCGYSTREGDTK